MTKTNRFKILYIDDDPFQLKLFRLKYSHNFDVKVAEFAQNGLEILKNDMDIDVVISDYDMPFMNGLEFVEKARKIKNDIPFYLLSSTIETDEIREAIKNKVISSFFLKPFIQSRLLKEIELHFDHTK